MSITTTVPYSPLRPEFVTAERLMWTANATRYTTTERRGRAHASDQGRGHDADMERLREHLATFTVSDWTAFAEYLSATKAGA